MEDPTPEQVEAPEGGCGPWEAHAGASSWQDRWTREEGSPRQGRFAGRTCDPVGDPTLEQFAPEVQLILSKAHEVRIGEVVFAEELMRSRFCERRQRTNPEETRLRDWMRKEIEDTRQKLQSNIQSIDQERGFSCAKNYLTLCSLTICSDRIVVLESFFRHCT
ncbi:hypothetical protein GRJ2_001240900 [Grus japonensis]|uniref:Uncharacterized protein n=1 Tax=Grus japonensis TaxID=30415 RepID=A0ABC9WR52_GRUJA